MPVGTLVLPDPSDVRLGVGYGADGTEFVGTLYAPTTAQANSLLARLKLMVAQMRNQGLTQQVTIEVRAAGDNYGTGESFEARRLPQTSTSAGGLAANQARWAVYRIAGQTGQPARLTRLTDALGGIWLFDSVERSWPDAAGVDLRYVGTATKQL